MKNHEKATKKWSVTSRKPKVEKCILMLYSPGVQTAGAGLESCTTLAPVMTSTLFRSGFWTRKFARMDNGSQSLSFQHILQIVLFPTATGLLNISLYSVLSHPYLDLIPLLTARLCLLHRLLFFFRILWYW